MVDQFRTDPNQKRGNVRSDNTMEQQGSTCTQRQQLLLEELQNNESEMTGQQLHRCLEGQPGAMGLATVYRNLRKLHQQGRVRCRHLPTGEALYAPVERDQHHLTCVSCGETQTLEQCPVHEMKVQAPESDNFKLIFHTLEFFGLCKRCRTER